MLNYYGSKPTFEIDCNCPKVIETFAVIHIHKRAWKGISQRFWLQNGHERSRMQIVYENRLFIGLNMFAMKKSTAYVKVGIFACCRRQPEWIKDSVVYTVIVFVGSQIQVGQHWFPSLIYPAKASLCQRPVRAIHTYIYLWRVTCQSHSEPWAVSLGPALQACSYNTFCQTCCSIVLWGYCLTHLPFWLVSHDCTHQTIQLPFTHVQRALATTKHNGKSQHTELCNGAVQGLQCR